MANTFEIKSAQLSLVSLVLKSGDLQQISSDLLAQFGPDSDSADFFDHDGLVIDFGKMECNLTVDALSALLQTLATCRLKPIAFRSGHAAHASIALAAGLIEASADAVLGKPAVKQALAKPVEVVKQVVREVPGPATMVVDRPLRSGQKIYARGADLVVLAMVNPGAEVAADGNIHVYAPLRGKAMAGASGNTQARIFSLCMEPELISIAGVYRTSEKPLPASIHGKPAQVRLSHENQDRLLFEPLNP